MQHHLILLIATVLFFTSCQSSETTSSSPTTKHPAAATAAPETPVVDANPTETPSDATATPSSTDEQKSVAQPSTTEATKPVTIDLSEIPQPTATAQRSAPAKQKNTLNVEEHSVATTPAPKAEEVTTSRAATPDVVVKEAPVATPSAPDHTAWDQLLRAHVSRTGNVDYASLARKQPALEGYLQALVATPPQADWSKAETMAYWINAYNAYTVKLILDNYPVNSIKDIHGGNPWDVKWIQVGGKSYSLNQIENQELRARYGDARIHFAVNCAALSCPPLHNRAFTADNLNSKLASLTRKFINNEQYNTYTPSIAVSQIFSWYGSDFGDLRTYLNRYLETEIDAEAEIGFQEYDWGLNR